MKSLNEYIKKLSKLHSDAVPNRWPAITCHRAPHKPLLLLSIMDLFAQRIIKTNLIELIPDLGELFAIYWSKVMPPDQRGNIALPFFHLRSEKFWHLIPRPGKEEILMTIRQIRSVNKLLEITLGAKLDDELFFLLSNEESRNILQTLVIESYFAPEIQSAIIEQSKINREAFLYSQKLLEKGRSNSVGEALPEEREYRSPARDQGFRRAIVLAYNHRCAICGIRMLAPAGHTAVNAAHIIPWSISHNDSPRNGIALCRLCHWTFDEGLIGISAKYKVITSSQITSNNNVPGHLITLADRIIIGPDEKVLWPDLDAIAWHRQKVFIRQ